MSVIPTSTPACQGGCYVQPWHPLAHPGPAYTYPTQPFTTTYTYPTQPFTMTWPMSHTLTPDESDLLALLAQAYNAWQNLETRHPDDEPDFRRAIHDCQRLIALRVARRVNPEVWK